MGNFLITGVAGFIGARTAQLLLRLGHRVVGLDNFNDAYDVRLKRARVESFSQMSNFSLHTLDIENQVGLEKIFSENSFDAVIHLAGRAGVRFSVENPRVYMTTNACGTLNILECMQRYQVKKVVIASTSSLYAGQSIPFAEDLPVNRPISPYAASKKAAEVFAYTYHHLYGLDVSIVRYFTVYGPAGRPDMSPFRFIKWIQAGIPIQLYGDGKQSRDFTFVDDIAAGTIAALKPVGYDIVNLGGGRKPYSLMEMISMIEALVGKSAKLDRQEVHKTDMVETQADVRKADRLLDWRPTIDLPEGLEHCVKWYRDNYEWAQHINT